ncbi:hypothetical protein J2847_004127 [Azospirillum agricola]|uniref:portal protein n=1 Tax=Azospirillum agricola TaxID=1720247 RepID=UPI001AE6A134|nr:hypothetical protein [Azospirillum agricola]MBP2230818.1 hypothetical protein [Azospirillum agricola]
MPGIDMPLADAMDEQQAQAEAVQAQMRLQERARQIANDLDRLAKDAISKRVTIEDRWYADLRQYHGRYDAATETKLRQGDRSRLFVNQTRPKTNAWKARLSDLLFPTDDRNWGIQPTPVPELSTAAKTPEDHPDPQQAEAGQQARRMLEEAQARADAMQSEIEDQLTESRYGIHAREAIDDACQLGTGILKGPVVDSRTRRSWGKVPVGGPDGQPLAVDALVEVQDPRPKYTRVDPWRLYPDPNGNRVEECEYFFELHLLTKTELRRLAKKPGFSADAIRRLLREDSREAPPPWMAQLRSITDGDQASVEGKFTVWEYNGPLTAEQLRCLYMARGDAGAAADYDEIDPLDEVQAVVWFCQNEVLKFGIHILDSQDPIYSAFCFSRDKGSFWGHGVPSLMRDTQAAMNAAWRMMMDNAALSTGPQIVIDRNKVEPVDGNWDLKPRKVWYAKTDSIGQQGLRSVFETYPIDSRQSELLNIIKIAKEFVDDEVSLPLISQGEAGAHQTQTANGMSMLQNAANVIFRDAVKDWDDEVTTPNIRRLYDWNMQFNPKESIKGDFEVDARGTSVLLVREAQAQNLMAMCLQFTAHPVLGPLMKPVQLLRKTVQAHMLSADELVKTDDEIAKEQQAQQEAQDQQQEDPRAAIEMQKIQADMQRAQLDAQTKIQVAEINRETELVKLAAQQNLTIEQLRAKVQMQETDQAHKERIFAAEVGFKDRQSAKELAAQALPAPASAQPSEPAAGTRFAP